MNENVTYGKFWDRAGAYILDGIILGTVTIGLNYINITQFKSFAFYLPIALIGILYKPFLESYYGATLGKMALDLKVTDVNYNKIDFEKSLRRRLNMTGKKEERGTICTPCNDSVDESLSIDNDLSLLSRQNKVKWMVSPET